MIFDVDTMFLVVDRFVLFSGPQKLRIIFSVPFHLQDVPVLMLAGEATHEHFYSTTHGAYDTGKNQALNFLCHHVVE